MGFECDLRKPDVLHVRCVTHSGQNSSSSSAPAASPAAPETPPEPAGPSSQPPEHLQIQ